MKEQFPKYAERQNKGKYRSKQSEKFKIERPVVYVEGNWQAKKIEEIWLAIDY